MPRPRQLGLFCSPGLSVQVGKTGWKSTNPEDLHLSCGQAPKPSHVRLRFIQHQRIACNCFCRFCFDFVMVRDAPWPASEVMSDFGIRRCHLWWRPGMDSGFGLPDEYATHGLLAIEGQVKLLSICLRTLCYGRRNRTSLLVSLFLILHVPIVRFSI